MKLDHIAIKTLNIEKSLTFYKKLWFNFCKILENKIEQQVYELEKDWIKLELINSFIFEKNKLIKKLNVGFWHIGFIVNKNEFSYYKKLFKDWKSYHNKLLNIYQIEWPSWEEIHFNCINNE